MVEKEWKTNVVAVSQMSSVGEAKTHKTVTRLDESGKSSEARVTYCQFKYPCIAGVFGAYLAV